MEIMDLDKLVCDIMSIREEITGAMISLIKKDILAIGECKGVYFIYGEMKYDHVAIPKLLYDFLKQTKEEE